MKPPLTFGDVLTRMGIDQKRCETAADRLLASLKGPDGKVNNAELRFVLAACVCTLTNGTTVELEAAKVGSIARGMVDAARAGEPKRLG